MVTKVTKVFIEREVNGRFNMSFTEVNNVGTWLAELYMLAKNGYDICHATIIRPKSK